MRPPEDVNPCTGKLVFYEETIKVTEHRDHSNNFVGRTSGSVFASDGYVLQSRVEHFQANKNTLALNLMEIWRYPDGAALRVTINAKVNLPGEELRFEKFKLECLGVRRAPERGGRPPTHRLCPGGGGRFVSEARHHHQNSWIAIIGRALKSRQMWVTSVSSGAASIASLAQGSRASQTPRPTPRRIRTRGDGGYENDSGT